jgi:pimeloyl-ACP methyl ester carboxylesterase
VKAAALLIALSSVAQAQLTRVADPPQRPWQHWRVSRNGLPAVDIYIIRDDKPKPLIVFASGSHCVPVFFYQNDKGRKRFRSTLLFQEFLEKGPLAFHFAVVERRGLKSFTQLDELNDNCTAEHGSVTKKDRVLDVVDAAEALKTQPWVSELDIAGHSEGGDVATGVVQSLKNKVAGVGVFAGCGPSQFFDHVVEARRRGNDADVQRVFDEELSLTSSKPPARYRGFPVERYMTYAVHSSPLDDMRGLDVPVFVAQGTRDRNAPVESADLFVAELLRMPTRSVKYLILPGLDHGFFTADGDDHQADVLKAFSDWILRKHRGVETRVFPSPAKEGP